MLLFNSHTINFISAYVQFPKWLKSWGQGLQVALSSYIQISQSLVDIALTDV